ncbi:MAG: glycyl-radical enzyme activating protein [Desulfotomaculaceae bacterium]|nr:glycyl-radical enzyme activating protein [Desulfotomaculaceae bacterium]
MLTINTGIIADIKKFETHDGPGIRTTVFIKGCFLRCKWCANPETLEAFPQLYFVPKRCKSFGECIKVCPAGAISMLPDNKIDRKKCTLCMKCVDVCPYSAFKQVGSLVTVDEVIEEVEKDKPFYGLDGGLTISGGEPLYQPGFTRELLKRSKEKGISTVLDTTGYAKWEDYEDILKYTDMVLLDLKHMDPAKHMEGTGVSNKIILENAKLISKTCETRISLPLISGFNNSNENLIATAEFLKKINIEWVDILPLHSLGASKYEYLGLTSPYTEIGEINKEEVVEARDIFTRYGFKTTIGRMI